MEERQIPDITKAQRNSREIRWYILLLPVGHRGPAKGLRKELEYRQREGLPLFDYFAPQYKEVKRIDGKFVESDHALYFNYVFVKASEEEIYRMKQHHLAHFNFMPRVKVGDKSYYPYLTERGMDLLRWIAKAYSNVLPVCTIEPDQLIAGDRVRIVSGQFAGAEASVVKTIGGGSKAIMVRIENWMWVPLLHVRPSEYEIIALNEEGKHAYTQLDNERIQQGLHLALEHRMTGMDLTDADIRIAQEALKLYNNLEMGTDVMRSKLYSILLQAHTILSDREEQDKVMARAQAILPLLKAEQSKALLSATLYGCTDNLRFKEEADKMILRWKEEVQPKKLKRQLIRRLEDYNRWFGHDL